MLTSHKILQNFLKTADYNMQKIRLCKVKNTVSCFNTIFNTILYLSTIIFLPQNNHPYDVEIRKNGTSAKVDFPCFEL